MLSAKLIEDVKMETRRGGSLHFMRETILEILDDHERLRRRIKELEAKKQLRWNYDGTQSKGPTL